MSLLSKAKLEKLSDEQHEWCVSIFMPTHRAGDQVRQDPVRLKNLIGEAKADLTAEGGLRGTEAAELLEPARALVAQHDFWRYQSDGLAIFVSPNTFRCYRLPVDFEELVVVADRFHIKPLLPLLSGDGRFYVLALSQNEIRMLQGTRYSVGQVELESVPESLAEALKWDDPEKQLQWHTQTGSEADGRAAVFHGHGAASEDDPKDYIRRYFQRIDDGLHEVLAGETAPLVLAGVDYLHPIYKEANSYPHLADDAVIGNPEELSAEELHQQAWNIVEPYFQEELKNAADQYSQLAGTGSELASSEIEQVVPAAYQARVEALFVPIGIQRWGSFDPATNEIHLHEERKASDEDLLDFAAVHTLLNGGTIYAVSPEQIPGGTLIAAIFRY